MAEVANNHNNATGQFDWNYGRPLCGEVLIDANFAFITAFEYVMQRFGRDQNDVIVAHQMANWIVDWVKGFANFSFERCIESQQNSFVFNPRIAHSDQSFRTDEGKLRLRRLDRHARVTLFDADLQEFGIHQSFDSAWKKACRKIDNEHDRLVIEKQWNKRKQAYLLGDFRISNSQLTQRLKERARDYLPSEWMFVWGRRSLWVDPDVSSNVSTSEKGVDTRLALEIVKRSSCEIYRDLPPDFLGVVTRDEDIVPAIEHAIERTVDHEYVCPPCITWTALGKRAKALERVISLSNQCMRIDLQA